MAGTADPLEAPGDRLRALHLDHQVDCAHVDAQLERRGRHQAGDLAALEQLLHLDPLLPGQRAVVCPRDLRSAGFRIGRQLVEAQRQPLGEPAVVDEDDRRAMLLDQPQQLGVDGRPDRGCGHSLRARAEQRVGLRSAGARLAHVLDRDDDPQVELFAGAGVDEPDRPGPRDEATDLLERALRRGQADTLDGLADEPVEPLDREREVGAPLGACDGMHLVEDQRADAPEHVAALRGEEQEQRLGRGDQDVGRLAQHRGPLLLGRVAGANGDGQRRLEAGQRAAQVPLDVVVQRLQRRDVEQPQPLARRLVQPVDAVEERGERLPGAGRRLDQRVLARGDRRPARLLCRRRRRRMPARTTRASPD